MAGKAFRELNWHDSYGGETWGKIADAWRSLDKAKTRQDMAVWIDHVYDLQHNTDTVFNKLKSYYKDRGYGWIKDALDFKANLKDLWELYDKVSPSMQRLTPPVLHASGWGSLEEFRKGKSKPTAQPLKPEEGDPTRDIMGLIFRKPLKKSKAKEPEAKEPMKVVMP